MVLTQFFNNPLFCNILPTGKSKVYADYYNFWFSYLTERCINIFKWKGLPFKQQYLELYLIMIGWGGIVQLDDSLNPFDAVQCSMSGVTNYANEYRVATGVTPLQNVMFHIYGQPPAIELVQREGVVVNNNHIRAALAPLIDYYADMLAHLDLSIKKVAVNMRVDAFIKGADSTAVTAIAKWYKSIEDGKSIGVLDENMFEELTEGIMVNPIGSSNNNELSELLSTRVKYINGFFSDIGINTAEEKRERLITNEVTVGFNRVLFNISDMEDARKEGAEQISELFQTQVEVELNPNLKIDFVSTQQQEGDENIDESKE